MDPPNDINDIILADKQKGSEITEYAIATDGGLFFVTVSTTKDYPIVQNRHVYKESENVKCISKIRDGVYLIAVSGC